MHFVLQDRQFFFAREGGCERTRNPWRILLAGPLYGRPSRDLMHLRMESFLIWLSSSRQVNNWGLAMGFEPRELGIAMNRVQPKTLLDKIGVK